jgi:hypothetical protein
MVTTSRKMAIVEAIKRTATELWQIDDGNVWDEHPPQLTSLELTLWARVDAPLTVQQRMSGMFTDEERKFLNDRTYAYVTTSSWYREIIAQRDAYQAPYKRTDDDLVAAARRRGVRR